ncbi:hypothetical protein [Natrinema sp. DC36]|uniref:hypothetical protein n=1 Tax=Natrinema sp. DC36 TaxID=2878680 RepID=UPI001CF0A532|nr:hypothetical protein [Natrinema sp. DC36]
MTDEEIQRLERELKYAQEALVVLETGGENLGHNPSLVNSIPVEYRHLARGGHRELEEHIERLKVDIESRKGGFL